MAAALHTHVAPSTEKVWRAVTEPEHLARWFPTTIEGERAAGARLRFAFPAGQLPAFEGAMTAYEPPSLMELRWGPDLLRLELRPVAQGTELTLLDTLEALGKAARDGTGWHTCLDALEAGLQDREDAREELSRWEEFIPTTSSASARAPPRSACPSRSSAPPAAERF